MDREQDLKKRKNVSKIYFKKTDRLDWALSPLRRRIARAAGALHAQRRRNSLRDVQRLGAVHFLLKLCRSDRLTLGPVGDNDLGVREDRFREVEHVLLWGAKNEREDEHEYEMREHKDKIQMHDEFETEYLIIQYKKEEMYATNLTVYHHDRAKERNERGARIVSFAGARATDDAARAVTHHGLHAVKIF